MRRLALWFRSDTYGFRLTLVGSNTFRTCPSRCAQTRTRFRGRCSRMARLRRLIPAFSTASRPFRSRCKAGRSRATPRRTSTRASDAWSEGWPGVAHGARPVISGESLLGLHVYVYVCGLPLQVGMRDREHPEPSTSCCMWCDAAAVWCVQV